jgi:O-antigen/teichoic acid export membrane protein
MTLRSTRTIWEWVTGHALARVGKNAFALLAAQVGAKLLNLALTAQLARALGVAALGRYLLAMTVQTITLAVADLGINLYTVRELARGGTAEINAWTSVDPGQAGVDRTIESNGREDQELWGTALALKLLAALCGTLALNLIIAPLFFPGQRRTLIAIASLSLLPDAMNGIATAAIKARQRMEISSAINLATRLAAALAGVLLVWSGKDERSVLLAYAAASLLGSCAFISVLWVWRMRARLDGLRQRWRAFLREAAPFAVTGIVAILYTRIDLLMLAHWQGDLAAGLYGAAYRVWEALGILPASLLDALFPELSRVGADRENHAPLRALYRRGRMLVWLLIGLVAAPCWVFAPHLMALLYGQSADTAIASALFRALLISFPFTYLYLLNGHLLYAVGQQLWVTKAMIAATAANALLNALLIPRWSYQGAAGAAIVSQVLLYAFLQGIAGRTVLRAAETPDPAKGGEQL